MLQKKGPEHTVLQKKKKPFIFSPPSDYVSSAVT